MRNPRRRTVSAVAGVLVLGVLPSYAVTAAEPEDFDDVDAVITGDAVAEGTSISDRLYGVFYEDINHAADGGLYAELVQNRSFEFNAVDNPGYDGLTAWEQVDRGGATGDVAVATTGPLNENNLTYLRVTVTASGSGESSGVAVRNSGFNTGVVVEDGESYDYSFWARHGGTQDVPVRVAVEDVSGDTVYAAAETAVTSGDWTKYEGVLTASGSTTTGRLAVTVDGTVPAGTTVDVDMVSLFPQDTFMGRENGLRADLAGKIADLEPSFLRFPGGCLVNAGSFDPFPDARHRVYDWKDTIGPVGERPTNRNFWGYNQSYGLGYFEYFQFAEDLGAEPLPVVSVGVNGCGLHDQNRITDPDELAPWIQDTLDLIEFANGDVDTEWGAKRAELGHPEPFGLESIALGNEEYDLQFLENYPLFHQAVREAYPDIEIISNSGTAASGDVFDRNWEMSRELGADLVDEHYYVNQSFLLTNTDRYDDYDRSGPHVFVGEFAARADPQNYNNFYSALSEAAYLTGIERNADVVEMAAYAPLLANSAYVNWAPDLIWFDNHRSYGSPSYYVQQMYSRNRGDTVVPTTLDASAVPPEEVDRVPGRFGNAVQLNGDSPNQYVEMPDGLVSGLDGDFTIATWVNRAVTGQDWSRIFDFGTGTDVNMFLTPNAGGPAGIRFAITTEGNCCEEQITYDQELPTGWQHVAVTLSDGTGTLWLNGEPVATNDAMTLRPADLGETDQNWIGRSQYGADPFLNATVDEFQIFDGALSQEQVQSLMATAGGDAGGGNVAWYRFDEDGGPTALDSSGNGEDATIVTSTSQIEPLYHVVTRDEDTGDIVLKVVNARPAAITTGVDLGAADLGETGTVTTMAAALDDRNSFDEPTNVVPVTEEVSGLGNRFTYRFPGNSITFVRLHDARTTTGLDAKVAPSSVPDGTSTTVTGRLTGLTGNQNPTGTVTVASVDGTVLGVAGIGPRPTVRLQVSAGELGVGTHELTVSYSGDAHFRPSSDTVELTVTPARGPG